MSLRSVFDFQSDYKPLQDVSSMADVGTPTAAAGDEPVATNMVELVTPTATVVATIMASKPHASLPRVSRAVRKKPASSSSSDSSNGQDNNSSIFDLPSVTGNRPNTIPGVAQKTIVAGGEEDSPLAKSNATRANLTALLLVLSYVAVSILYFHFVENWSVVDCIYFAMVIVTTVGYGDVIPVKTAGKAFTIFFAFYGIATIGMALGRLASWFLSRQREIARETTQRLLSNVDSAADHCSGDPAAAKKEEAVAIKTQRSRQPKWLKWLLSDSNKAIVAALVPILVSIGGGLILGAIEGWPVLDCFYFAIITITTVGFGDLSPKSEAARIYAIFYLPLSVVSVAHGIGSIIEELGKRKVLKSKISMKELLAMDSDGDGKVSQLEYLSYMLVKLGKADQSDIDGILAQFRKLDKDGSGELDKDDLERLDRHLERQQERKQGHED